MKRLWIALALMGAILGGTLAHTWFLRGFTGELTSALEQADGLARAQRWEEAAALTEETFHSWRDRDVYLHVLLRHADTDEIYAGFQEVLALLDSGEYGEYAAANARLCTRIALLSEAEQLTLKNVF